MIGTGYAEVNHQSVFLWSLEKEHTWICIVGALCSNLGYLELNNLECGDVTGNRSIWTRYRRIFQLSTSSRIPYT
jgi:hypothetical protein